MHSKADLQTMSDSGKTMKRPGNISKLNECVQTVYEVDGRIYSYHLGICTLLLCNPAHFCIDRVSGTQVASCSPRYTTWPCNHIGGTQASLRVPGALSQYFQDHQTELGAARLSLPPVLIAIASRERLEGPATVMYCCRQ